MANWRQSLDLIETILVYQLLRLSREEIQRLLHLPEVELKQMRFYQDVFAEGRAEGHTEGRAEGRAEGQQQGEATLVLRLLQRRLGALSTDMENQIRTLPVADREALGEALLDWQTRLNCWRGSSARATPARLSHVQRLRLCFSPPPGTPR